MQTTKIVSRLLQELSSKKDLIELLNYVQDEIETKNDPDPIEIQILNDIYRFLESFKVMELNMRNFINEGKKKTTGNVLSRLLDNVNTDGFYIGE